MAADFQLAGSSVPLSISSKFILPPDKRPNPSDLDSSAPALPIIDLQCDGNSNGRLPLIRTVAEACEEYGFFQVLNHGVPEELCREMAAVAGEFFSLPVQDRARLYSKDRKAPVRVFTPYLGTQEEGRVTLWVEHLSHVCYPIEGVMHLLPSKPASYRDTAAEYAKEIGKLVWRLLGLISEGLGLKEDFLHEKLSDHKRIMQVNHYPPCPDPELTLGLAAHTDLGVITILQQAEGVSGLQVIKDGKWIPVHPLPNVLVVNIGDQLDVITNGRYKSALHRAVVNQSHARVSIATSFRPGEDVVIEPIGHLIDEQHPPLYRSYQFKEFFSELCRKEGERRRVKEAFMSHP